MRRSNSGEISKRSKTKGASVRIGQRRGVATSIKTRKTGGRQNVSDNDGSSSIERRPLGSIRRRNAFERKRRNRSGWHGNPKLVRHAEEVPSALLAVARATSSVCFLLLKCRLDR